MAEHTLTLHIDGPHTYGDLHVTGFVTARTAREVGDRFAAALCEQFPGATVTPTVKPEPKEPTQ